MIAVAIALSAYEAAGIDDRVVRAADTMEHLRGVRFSLEANVSATGSGAVGDVLSRYRGTGELVPPDRMRLVVTEPRPATLVIVGQRVLLDGEPASATALRTLASPVAVLEQLRERGAATFSGFGFARGSLTARYRIDRGDRGIVEVELGILDDLVRRQTFTVTEAAPPDGSGLEAVRTAYVVEYWDHGAALEVREPDRP